MLRLGTDAKFLKKDVKWCELDVHPTEKAILVRYELEATILGEAGNPMLGESKECQKIIRLKDLNESTDAMALAQEIVKKCKLIPTGKTDEVEQLIYYLQKRRSNEFTAFTPQETTQQTLVSGSTEKASLNKLESYIELLYEGIGDKVRGTALVLQLARNPDNLDEIMANETLIGALARVLKEDWKKSFELATNIACIFYCFSTFTQFHPMISHFKIGALCLQIVDFEVQRYERWQNELKKSTDPNAQAKFDAIVAKQEQLLRVCTHLLFNLSDDGKVEQKMANRGIVPLLCRMLAMKSSTALPALVCAFAAKLAMFRENKDEMAKNGIVEHIAKLFAALPSRSDELATAVLQLLFNLSFDSALRARAISAGLVPPVAACIARPGQRRLATQLLYMYSTHDECKSMLTYTDAISLCMAAALSDDEECALESKCILLNCAFDKRNAQLLAEGLTVIVERALQSRDILLAKLVRNIAHHDDISIQKQLTRHIPALTSIFVRSINGDSMRAASQVEQRTGAPSAEWRSFAFALDCLGTVASVKDSSFDWTALHEHCQLFDWICNMLRPATVDDVLLETVVLLGSMAACNQAGAQVIVNARIVELMIALLSARQEDDEIVLQIIYAFYQMLFYEPVRQYLLQNTDAPAYLIDLMHDKNAHIRRMCDSTLDVIAEAGEKWARRIVEERFRWHNAQWLEMVGIIDGDGEIHDDNERFALDESSGEEVLQADDVIDSYDEEETSEVSSDNDA